MFSCSKPPPNFLQDKSVLSNQLGPCKMVLWRAGTAKGTLGTNPHCGRAGSTLHTQGSPCPGWGIPYCSLLQLRQEEKKTKS